MSVRRPDAAEPNANAAAVSVVTLRARDALGVLALALALRAWHLFALRDSAFFDVLTGDSLGYDSWARRLAAGDWLGSEVFYQAPLYPYFLGFLYASVSDDLFSVLFAQALLGSLACLLLASAAARLLQSRSAGVAAGIMLALYAPAIFHDGLIQKSALDLFLLCGLLWLLSRIQDRPRASTVWGAGVALGALTLTRENAGVLLLPIGLWLWLHFRSAGSNRIAALSMLAALGVGLASVLLPVSLRNYSIDGRFHLTTSQFGPNFYIGNNAKSDGTYQSLRFARGDARYENEDAELLAEQALGRELSSGEVSDYWTDQALDHITGEPLDWLALMLRKWLLLINSTEIVDTEDQYTYATWSPVLRVSGSLFHFGVLAPLALMGVFVAWDRRQRLWLLYLMAATYAGSVTVFYVVARYRLPLAPFLMVGAAAAVADARSLPARIAALPRAGVAAITAAIGILALACNWPLVDRPGMGAANHYNLGIALHTKGDSAAALDHFRSALEIVPQYPEALWAAGLIFAGSNRLDEAVANYRAAIGIQPNIALLHHSLADALSKKRDVPGSIRHYQEALRLEPDLASAHFYLAIALAISQREAEGRSHAESAVTLEPELGKRLRDVAWRRATMPGVGNPRSTSGQLALHLARWAAELTKPATARSLDVLAAGHAAVGQFRAAGQIGREAVALATKAGDAELAAKLAQRLDRYDTNQPFLRGR